MKYLNLPMDKSEQLIDDLSKMVIDGRNIIDKEIDDFSKSNKKYKVLEISESMILVLTRQEPHGVFLNVGFPFPVHTAGLDYLKTGVPEIGVNIHIRGEPVRKLQRTWIKNFIDSKFGVFEYAEVNDLEDFREIVSEICRKGDSWIYVDPYDYIGDGFIGFHFFETFLDKFGHKEIEVLSKSHHHMKSLYKTHPKNPELFSSLLKESTLAIIPDLIDNQVGRTLSFIDAAKGKTLTIFLIGRNMIIEIDGNNAKIFHYNEPDNLFRNTNIEDYMNGCLEPFLSRNEPLERGNGVGPASKEYNNKEDFYFINSFTSTKFKDISADFVLGICDNLVREKAFKIYISRGLRDSEKDVEWIDDFLEKISGKKFKHIMNSVEVVYFEDLSDVALKLKKFGVGAILTSDTSISHLVNSLHIPQITLYRKSFWDSSSIQSLTSDSPLGFCRYFKLQFPAILDEDTISEKSFSEIVSKAMVGLQSLKNRPKDNAKLGEFHKKIHAFVTKKQLNAEDFRNTHTNLCKEFNDLKGIFEKGELSWLFDVYSPCEMTKGISDIDTEKTEHLIRASWKISPIYKFHS